MWADQEDVDTKQVITEIPTYMFEKIDEVSVELFPNLKQGRARRREILSYIMKWWFAVKKKNRFKPKQFECDMDETFWYNLKTYANVRDTNAQTVLSFIIQLWTSTEIVNVVEKIRITKAEFRVEEAQRELTDAIAALEEAKDIQVPQLITEEPPDAPSATPITQIIPVDKPKVPKKKYYKKAKSVPKYTVLKPDETYEDVKNLAKFCEEHGVSYNSLSKRLYIQPNTGKKIISPVKGFYVWRIDDPDVKKHKSGELVLMEAKTSGGGAPKKSYRIIWPNGDEEIFTGMDVFSQKHGFSPRRIHKMKNGTDKEGIKIEKVEVGK